MFDSSLEEREKNICSANERRNPKLSVLWMIRKKEVPETQITT